MKIYINIKYKFINLYIILHLLREGLRTGTNKINGDFKN